MYPCKENKGEETLPPNKLLSWVFQNPLQTALLLPQSMTGQPEEISQISLKSTPRHQNLEHLISLSYTWSPLSFSEGAEGKERTQISIIFKFLTKFQVLHATVLRGRRNKALCMSIFGHFTRGELQFCKPAAVLPTSFDCSYCNNHNFLWSPLQRQQEEGKVDRNKVENEDKATALQDFS